MQHPAPDPALALEYLTGRRDPAPLLAAASRLRDEGRGRTVTYSRKVFVPLTTLCRDKCTYCTFAKPPGAGVPSAPIRSTGGAILFGGHE